MKVVPFVEIPVYNNMGAHRAQSSNRGVDNPVNREGHNASPYAGETGFNSPPDDDFDGDDLFREGAEDELEADHESIEADDRMLSAHSASTKSY